MTRPYSLLYVLSFLSTLALSQNITTTALIENATVNGINTGAVTKFLGISYASAARFAMPIAVPLYSGLIDATSYGPSCPAQTVKSVSLSSKRSLESVNKALRHFVARGDSIDENCLSINVIQPAGTKPSDKLPVVVWIYGGGFEAGSTESYDALGTNLVTRSIQLGTPIIYVAMNYRLSAYGFLASEEVQGENIGNFGLYDQRVGLKWTKKYIKNFGGDASKVTLWGQSAGAISASLQMLAFGGNTENLFRAAFMQSGAPIPVGKLTNGQKYYDFLVTETGCRNATSTLQCLREVSFDTLHAAVEKTPNYMGFNGLSLAWSPRVDGIFLRQSPFEQIHAGKVANIPIVSGNTDDEGTIFSLAQSSVSTKDDFRGFLKTLFFPSATDDEITSVTASYPSDPSAGSPFDTGTANVVYPQYKRIAAFQGDIVFQAPRRYFLQSLPRKQKVWSYLSKVYKPYSVLGSYHFSDIDSGILIDYLVNFVVAMNPNNPTTPSAWPQYNATSPKLYIFTDGALPSVTDDTYRADPIQNLIDLSITYPI